MDFQGNYLSRINNPFLEHIVIGSIIKKGALYPKWNADKELFVYMEMDTTIVGTRISTTDMYGEYYKTYTSGLYYDYFHCWGPGGDYILFNRADDIKGTGIFYKLMIIDVRSGEVREFLKPGDIPGAIMYLYPDF